MKIKSIAVAALVGLVTLLPGRLMGQLKIGYINSQAILSEMEEVRDMQAKLDKETRRLEAEYTRMVGRADSLRTDYQKQQVLMSSQKKAEKEQDIQRLINDIQIFEREKFGPQGQVYQIQAQLMQPILEKVDRVIKQVGAERSYDYILDTVNGGVVYAIDAHELTQDILKALRSGN